MSNIWSLSKLIIQIIDNHPPKNHLFVMYLNKYESNQASNLEKKKNQSMKYKKKKALDYFNVNLKNKDYVFFPINF